MINFLELYFNQHKVTKSVLVTYTINHLIRIQIYIEVN